MVSASRYEREFIAWASQIGMVTRAAASGVLNTMLGDLIILPHVDVFEKPIVVEVKSTHRDRYYISWSRVKVDLIRRLADIFNFVPLLAVRFIDKGWVIYDLRGDVPRYITPDDAFFIPYNRKTLTDWLSSPDFNASAEALMKIKGGGVGGYVEGARLNT